MTAIALIPALQEELLRRTSLYPVVNTAMSKLWQSLDLTGPPKDPEVGSKKIMVFVRNLYGKCITIYMTPSETVEQLKYHISRSEKMPICQQILYHAGRSLENNRSLSDYSITNESTVHLTSRLRGGMYHSTSGRSDLNPLFVLEVQGPDKFGLYLAVHAGITLANLLDQVITSARSCNEQQKIQNCHLVLNDIPIASGDIESETLESLGIASKLNIPLVLMKPTREQL